MSTELIQAAERHRAARPAAGRVVPELAVRRLGFEAAAPTPSADVAIIVADAGGTPADWVLAPAANPTHRLLYLHGGGYSVGSRRSHRRLAGDISRSSGCTVLIIDYRMAPEVPFPGAVDDALAAFRWMRSHGPDGLSPATALFIAGDSAGGGLTLATLIALRDAGERLPEAAVTLSAWTDLACTGASFASRAEADPVLTGGREAVRQAARQYLGDADETTPLASPLYADFQGLPPLLMQVGDDEVLLDDTLRVAERAQRQGVAVTLTVEPGAFHVYQYFEPEAPESCNALAQLGAFLRSYATDPGA